jgi:predicted phosphoadenosine phosphosulfate sulfurtransferase
MSEREAALLWARHPTHRRRVAEAEAVVAAALARCARPYVAFSGGKDSAALLWLARRAAPAIPARILLWPESHLLGDYDAVLAAWAARGPAVEPLRLTRASLAERAPERWGRLHAAGGHDAVLVGLRMDESRVRRISLARWGAIHQPAAGPLRVAPLMRWTTLDVAAAIEAHDLPCLSVYREEGYASRTSTRIPREAVRDRALADLRARDPAAWAALRQVYPGEI